MPVVGVYGKPEVADEHLGVARHRHGACHKLKILGGRQALRPGFYQKLAVVHDGLDIGREVRKHFFFEKKKQKTFTNWRRAGPTDAALMSRRFLLLFFKKEVLSFGCNIWMKSFASPS
jgi:hypothetical protein